MARIGTLGRHNGAGLWYVRINGDQKYLGTKTTTKEEAEVLRAKLILQTETEEKSAEENEKEGTLAGVMAYYLNNADLNQQTKNAADRKRYVEALIEEFGTLKPTDLKPFMLEKWINGTAAWNVTTKVNVYKHLSAAFNWLVLNDKLSRNPCKGAKKPVAKKRGLEYVISEDEYKRILPLVRPVYREVVQLMWLAGMRPGEVCGFTAEEYRPDCHSMIKTAHKTAHKGKIRKIVLNEEAEAIIRDRVQRHPHGLLFRSVKGNRIGPDVMMQHMRRVFRKAGITHPCDDYSFRHSAAVRWIRAKIPLEIVAGFLGNTPAVCAKHYAHILEDICSHRSLLLAVS